MIGSSGYKPVYTPKHGSVQNSETYPPTDPSKPSSVGVNETRAESLHTVITHELAGTFLFVYSILAVATSKQGATLTDVAFAIATAAFVYSHVFSKAHFNTYVWKTRWERVDGQTEKQKRGIQHTHFFLFFICTFLMLSFVFVCVCCIFLFFISFD
jgi:uncharacterized membrane protein